MGYLKNLINKTIEDGYDIENAEAKVCQDIILKAISLTTMKDNITIKGGVVMRSISHNTRRATQDIDIDFIRYPISDEAIMRFVEKLNCIENINISLYGQIDELKQQDYHGKRVYIRIEDEVGDFIESKIDLGVHKNLTIDQEEYCFDLCLDDIGVSLLMNSKEQMFTEKLRSLLKFGSFSSRYKDIFDMYYLSNRLDIGKLLICFDNYIFSEPNMKENNINDVIRRVNITFKNKGYVNKLNTSRRNWLEQDTNVVLEGLIDFLEETKSYISVTI